jgi:hypothetical protein
VSSGDLLYDLIDHHPGALINFPIGLWSEFELGKSDGFSQGFSLPYIEGSESDHTTLA